jgi:RNA polymerase sigma factor (sigma-70 family)
MDSQEFLAERFEIHRTGLRGVAYRMLGSLAEADDAVQETWLRLSRSDTRDVENLGGWLTTVLARVCLDILRSRAVRREEPLGSLPVQAIALSDELADPQQAAVLADAVGLALLVVLDRLTPAERIAFVLHDLFAVSFADIGPIVGRSPTAAKKLASRARNRVRGAEAPDGDMAHRWRVAEAFLHAARSGNLDALLGVLDPDVVRRADRRAIPTGTANELHGARAVAKGTLLYSRTARHFARMALVDGAPGLVVAPRGRLQLALRLTIEDGKIIEIDVIAEPRRLRQLNVTLPFMRGLDGRDEADSSDVEGGQIAYAVSREAQLSQS